MIDKAKLFNDSEFTTDDIFKLAEIEGGSFRTQNEEFLLQLIDKFCLKIALLKSDLEDTKELLEQA